MPGPVAEYVSRQSEEDAPRNIAIALTPSQLSVLITSLSVASRHYGAETPDEKQRFAHSTRELELLIYKSWDEAAHQQI